MRIAVFSDVHANLEALTAILDAAAAESAERFVCLGDVVGYGANPNECCEAVRKTAAFTILGNHDAAVAGRMDYSFYYQSARQALDWHSRVLTSENMAWLRSLEYRRSMPEERVGFCHGSPIGFDEFRYIYLREQAEALLPFWNELEDITFIGHSHLCKIFALGQHDVEELSAPEITLRRGDKYVVSTGSVGQPRDYDNRACYVMFDTEKRRLAFRRVEYAVDVAAQKIFDAPLDPDFGRRLFLGV